MPNQFISLKKKNFFRKLLNFRLIFALFIFILGSGLSLFLFSITRQLEEQQLKIEFETQAQILAQAIKRRFDRCIDVLYSIESLYSSSVEVEKEEFQTFSRPLLNRVEGIQGLVWAPFVLEEDKNDFIKMAQEIGYDNFQITKFNQNMEIVPIEVKEEYYPFLYIETSRETVAPPGFDLNSEVVFSQTLIQSKDSGNPALTELIDSSQSSEMETDFLLLYPIFKTKERPSSIESRRVNFQGFIFGVFSLEEMMNSIFEDFNTSGICFQIFDHSSDEDLSPIYNCPYFNDINLDKNSKFKESIFFDMAGRKWEFIFYSVQEDGLPYQFSQSTVILITGILISFLLTVSTVFGTTQFVNILDLSDNLNKSNSDLTNEIEKRIKAEKELKSHMNQIERTNKLMVGREMEIVKLKNKLKESKK